MENIHLEKDIPVMYFNVPTFPAGIEEKFTEIMKMLPGMEDRTFYGISYINNDGKIIYHCAVTRLDEKETMEYGGTDFVLPKGEYLGESIHNWMSNLTCIKDVLMKLMDDPATDTSFPCIEWYKTDKDMTCMLRKSS